MKIEKLIKQETFDSSMHRAIINIMYTNNWFRDKQMIIFKKHNILPQHFNTLRIIKGRHPNPITPSEIKEVLIDKSNDTTRLIDKLVRLSLVQKKKRLTNKRKMDITITSEGIQILNHLNRLMEDLLNEIGRGLSEEESTLLSNLLDKIRI